MQISTINNKGFLYLSKYVDKYKKQQNTKEAKKQTEEVRALIKRLIKNDYISIFLFCIEFFYFVFYN